MDFEIDLLKKKKKKKKVIHRENLDTEEPSYFYIDMLTRIFNKMSNQSKPENNRKIPHCNVSRVGSKKTMWSNFYSICTILNRDHSHIMSFVLTELLTQGSLDTDKNLILKGVFKAIVINNILTKYINEYIKCRNCNSLNTTLIKNPATRLYTLQCQQCTAERHIKANEVAYHATTRNDRRK